jgi:hypothetical protein
VSRTLPVPAHPLREPPLHGYRRVLAQLGLTAVCLLGCATPPVRPPLTEDSYPGVLRAPEALGRDVLWRQRITATWGQGERRGFDGVVQKLGGTLTVMGLSPTGAMGFAIVQEGSTLALHHQMPEPPPFPPRFVLLDVQRALYPWLPGPDGVRDDGEHAADVDGEHVVELWRGGRLLERRFRRLDGEPPGEIDVHYEGGRVPGTTPGKLTLENGWFGYRLEVETLAEELLAGDGSSPP